MGIARTVASLRILGGNDGIGIRAMGCLSFLGHSEVVMIKKIVFEIESMDEPAAGITGTYDQVAIEVDSGDPGGEVGEFEEHMKQALSEWYDGAKITIL